MRIKEGNLLPVNYFCNYMGELARKKYLRLGISMTYYNGAVNVIEVYLEHIDSHSDCFTVNNVELNKCKSINELESIADEMVSKFSCESMRNALKSIGMIKDKKLEGSE